MQVFLYQRVEAGGGTDELLAELVVELLLFLHQRAVFGRHQFTGLLGGFLCVAEALGAALILQQLQFLLFAGETGTLVVALLDRQILHAGTVIQLLLQVGQLQVEQGQFGTELHLLGAGDAFTGVEAGTDLLTALVGTAHAGLGALRQGLQAGELAADGAEGLLGRLHVGQHFRLTAIELCQTHAGVFALDLLGTLALGQGIELGTDLSEFGGQVADPLGLGLGLPLFLVDAVEQAEGFGQQLLIRLLTDGQGF